MYNLVSVMMTEGASFHKMPQSMEERWRHEVLPQIQVILRPQMPHLFYINKVRARVTMRIRSGKTKKPAARTRRDR